MRTLARLALLAFATPLCFAQSFVSPPDSGPTSVPKKPIIFDVNALD